MVYLEERLVRMQTFKDKLFSHSCNGLIKQSLIQKLAENGLSHQDLLHLYSTGGGGGNPLCCYGNADGEKILPVDGALSLFRGEI